MHIKRTEMSKEWPLPRKGTKYVAVASHSKQAGIPLLFIIRDILKLAKTRKEVEYLMRHKEVKVNNKLRKEDGFPVKVFDTISFEKLNKNYKMVIENKKLKLEEVSAKEAEKKIAKISGKKILDGKTVQMNLESGDNFLVKEKFSVGDSVIINTKENKIEKIIPLKDGANIAVISGKHAGEKGKLKSVKELAREKVYNVQLNKKSVELPFKAILAVE